MYDIIVVGARCGGSPTAMLLARKGHKVLIVDRATFPSDTISTHILWPHGVELLARWGLAARLAATGVPPICRPLSFDVGPFALRGTVPEANDGRGGYCPRRTVLDELLLNAAAEAGAEVRQGCAVSELVFDDDRVVGIRGRSSGDASFEERARLVIGADGVHSLVARAAKAPEYDTKPVIDCGFYSYFSGVNQDDLEMYVRTGCAFGGAPTHQNLHLVMVSWPTGRFAEIRQDVDSHVAKALELAPEFHARVNSGRREERWYGMAGVPNYFRKPYGPGWALVGDAAYCRDPITAQGISDAFIDAQSIADAIDGGLSGRGSFDELLPAHERARNERVAAMYEFTSHLAALEPPSPEMQSLFGALRGNQDATNAFFSAITGATALGKFMSPDNLGRIISAATAH